MKIKFKIFMITVILLIFSITYVHAIDMFLTNSNTNLTINTLEPENASNNAQTNFDTPHGDEESLNNQAFENQNLYAPTNPAPNITTSYNDDDILSISDIIDIILISVCVVLIFLAIAILIRCK